MTRSRVSLSGYEWPDRLFHTSHQSSFLGGLGDLACCVYCPNGETEAQRGSVAAQNHALTFCPPLTLSASCHPGFSLSISILHSLPILTRRSPKSNRSSALNHANEFSEPLNLHNRPGCYANSSGRPRLSPSRGVCAARSRVDSISICAPARLPGQPSVCRSRRAGDV